MSSPVPTDQQPPTTPTSDVSGESQESTADKRRKRLLSYSTKNMVYSLLAVFALAFVVWAFIPSESAFQRRPADVAPVADHVAEQVEYQVYAPVDLGPEWTVTTARLTPIAGQDTWRLGAVHTDRSMVVLSQTQDPSQEWLDTFLAGTGQTGEQRLPGPDGEHVWEVHQGESEVYLVLPPFEGQPGTTIVHGNSRHEQLVEFVSSLQVVQP